MDFPLYKMVARYRLITKGRRVIGIDPNPLSVEYLPADEEGRKSFEDFMIYLAKGLDEYLAEKSGGRR